MKLERNYVLILDKSGSMAERDCPNGKTRWEYCQETTFSFASKMDQLDPDGIDIYVFSSNFKKYPNVKADKVKQIFAENDPSGSTALDLVLKDAIDHSFNGNLPTTVIVVTDGEPNDKDSVARLITQTSHKMEKDEDFAIGFIQIGRNEEAKKYLAKLDDELSSAKFDIVDAMTCDELENMSLSEALLKIVND